MTTSEEGSPARVGPAGPADPVDPADPIAAPAKKPSSIKNTVEWVAIIGAALVLAFVIKTFLLQAFYIPSESMVPTLKVRDRVLVNKLSYHLHAVHRGDIVVFKRPPEEQAGASPIKDLIKRVVGLPNETINLQDGKVVVNGRVLREPYLPANMETLPETVQLPIHLGPHTYLVLGDNRTNSRDGRTFGPIDRDLLVGRAFIRVWPVPKLSLL